VHHVGPPILSVQPAKVDFGLTWVGHPQDQQVIVSNDGSDAVVKVAVGAPFSVDVSTLEVAASTHSTLTVHYAPASAGHDTATLTIGALSVPLSGDARVEPDCPPMLCNDVFFDTLSRECSSKPVTDGTACHTGCITGSCQGGLCLGSPIDCDDGNACTIDSCSEPDGCSHSVLSCEIPNDPCKVGACDPVKGCVATAVLDGTSCGDDLCTSSSNRICLSGACVVRPRLAGTRCANQWIRPYMELHAHALSTWDSRRRREIQYGGGWSYNFTKETWEWDFVHGWQQVFPASSPDLYGGALGYDPNRQRTVLFGGSNATNCETWEYDGTTWTQASPAHSPPPMGEANLVYDTTAQNLVLFGGMYCDPYCAYPTDHWTWDGTDWTNVAPPGLRPPNQTNRAVGYDEYRSRLVVFGGTSNVDVESDLWEFDGTQWTEIAPPDGGLWPGGGQVPAFTFDESRSQLVLFGGSPDDGDGGQVWAWDGTEWTAQSYPEGPSTFFGAPPIAWDRQTQSVLAFSSEPGKDGWVSDWQWDGGQWSPRTPAIPSPRSRVSLAYDSLHDKVVMFGGFNGNEYVDFQQTWLWNGARWSIAPSDHSPPPRTEASMVFDASRGVTVLFGGVNYMVSDIELGDTWEWDGAAWTQRTPLQSPPGRYGAAMAYDPVRQKVMMFGGFAETMVSPMNDFWEYDGATWQQITTATTPGARVGARMVYDEAHQQLVLSGGEPERFVQANDLFVDTWTFDGNDWTDRTPASGQVPRMRFGMAYDSSRQRVWAFGGWTNDNTFVSSELNDTLQWDGTTWQTVTPLVSPPRMGGLEMIYDPTRDELLIVGGAGDDESSTINATWVYGPP
jgi:hypothetical protein